MAEQDTCTHDLQAFTEDQLSDLRRQARPGRPPMAWVEGASRCSRCDAIEAEVSWFGQVYHVPVNRTESGALAVQWPKRGPAPGASTSMG